MNPPQGAGFHFLHRSNNSRGAAARFVIRFTGRLEPGAEPATPTSDRYDLAPKHAQQPFARNFDRLEAINFQLASDGAFHGLPGHGYFGFKLFRKYEIVFKMAEWLIVVRLLNGLGHG
jgi:hypothetical protein